MKNKSCVATWVISRVMMMTGALALVACSQMNTVEYMGPVATPTVDYVESLDVYSDYLHHPLFLFQHLN